MQHRILHHEPQEVADHVPPRCPVVLWVHAGDDDGTELATPLAQRNNAGIGQPAGHRRHFDAGADEVRAVDGRPRANGEVRGGATGDVGDDKASIRAGHRGLREGENGNGCAIDRRAVLQLYKAFHSGQRIARQHEDARDRRGSFIDSGDIDPARSTCGNQPIPVHRDDVGIAGAVNGPSRARSKVQFTAVR